MKNERLRVYDYLRRLCLVSALSTGLGMTASISPGGRKRLWILTQSLGTQEPSHN